MIASASTALLADLCVPVFSLADAIRRGARLSAEQARFRFEELFRGIDREAQRAGYEARDVRYVLFALSATIDEALLSVDWPGRDEWLSEPLQLTLFNVNAAGEEFYSRLEQLRQRLGADARVADALEVFCLCMSMGFYGRYGASPALMKKHDDLIADLHRAIDQSRGQRGPLGGQHAVPQDRDEGRVRRARLWLVPLLCVLLLAAVFTGLQLHLRGQGGAVVGAAERSP